MSRARFITAEPAKPASQNLPSVLIAHQEASRPLIAWTPPECEHHNRYDPGDELGWLMGNAPLTNPVDAHRAVLERLRRLAEANPHDEQLQHILATRGATVANAADDLQRALAEIAYPQATGYCRNAQSCPSVCPYAGPHQYAPGADGSYARGQFYAFLGFVTLGLLLWATS